MGKVLSMSVASRQPLTSPLTLVLADDLTGAAASAAAFGEVASASVVLSPKGAAGGGSRWPDADLVALDTNTRHAEPHQAAAAIRRWLSDVAVPPARIYKAIDPLLRGNVAAEVAAALNVLTSADASANATVAVVAPAFPELGWTTLDGLMRVHDNPLPPQHGDGDVPGLLRRGGVPAGVVDLHTVRMGPLSFVRRCDELVRTGARAVVCDAETDDDLRVVQWGTDLLRAGVLLVGSAGLFRAAVYDLAVDRDSDVGGAQAEPGGTWIPRQRADRAGVLMVSDMPCRLSTPEVREVAAQDDVVVVELNAPFGPAQQASALARARSALRTPWRSMDAERAGCAERSEYAEHSEYTDVLLVPDRVESVRAGRSSVAKRALGAVASELLVRERALLTGAVLNGGATARAVLAAAGVRRLTISGELEPGAALATAEGVGALPFVTKSGSIGQPGALNRVRLTLHGPHPRSTPRAVFPRVRT